ncbi:MAG: hypothetical protein UR82_C0032G0008 [Candidatus Moranbacteria bacterium GW2011_GWF1_35_5]|nr:MAG: hypothetical protein UR82_C0032G0008 [Candidatus Moranbacteria bacterium GW2011_GWF1_35_5]
MSMKNKYKGEAIKYNRNIFESVNSGMGDYISTSSNTQSSNISMDEIVNVLKEIAINTNTTSKGISEIAANGKPVILIPLSTAANNHQGMNAYFLTERGGAIVLEESNIGRNMLIGKIENVLSDSELREKLSKNIQEFYHADASLKIAQGVLDLAR